MLDVFKQEVKPGVYIDKRGNIVRVEGHDKLPFARLNSEERCFPLNYQLARTMMRIDNPRSIGETLVEITRMDDYEPGNLR